MTQIKISDFEVVMTPNYTPNPILPSYGVGAKLIDQKGTEYIDFTGGIAVNTLGHSNPELISALTEQAQKCWHVSNIMTNEPALLLAKKLVASTFADKVFFANSGAEANEAALKLARLYASSNFSDAKDQIISCSNSFHGRTLFTVSTGGQPKYSSGFGPKPQSITHIKFNDSKSLEHTISNNTCAVILEIIQGEGGIVLATNEFLQTARALCDKHNAILIIDEVQTGVGRTGALYAYMETPIIPDILTSAKGLGGGFPIGAMLTTNKFAVCLQPGTHGSTFGGNPLACAVANKVLDIVNEAFLENVKVLSKIFIDKLEKLNAKFKLFKEIRGRGLLIGAELNSDYKDKANDFIALAIKHKLLLLVAGPNVIRLAPPLNITNMEIELGFSNLEKTISEFTKR